MCYFYNFRDKPYLEKANSKLKSSSLHVPVPSGSIYKSFIIIGCLVLDKIFKTFSLPFEHVEKPGTAFE